jgi:hypothetical protein
MATATSLRGRRREVAVTDGGDGHDGPPEGIRVRVNGAVRLTAFGVEHGERRHYNQQHGGGAYVDGEATPSPSLGALVEDLQGEDQPQRP